MIPHIKPLPAGSQAGHPAGEGGGPARQLYLEGTGDETAPHLPLQGAAHALRGLQPAPKQQYQLHQA
jgi:hypothetical protein